ncbi:MAG: F0F1 ATP synthase subunit epsilon [Pseudomonadota bacterium]|nr:F0F1 ATP synthase subunit epsilon [Pseudomonadota bacterium]
MERALYLTLGTPQALLRDRQPILALRASDASGSFGIHAGHENLLTFLPAGVVAWQEHDGSTCWCAVADAVIRVHGGRCVEIAAQEAVTAADRGTLEAQVRTVRQQEHEARRAARSDDTRLQAQAVRRLAAWMMASAHARSDR